MINQQKATTDEGPKIVFPRWLVLHINAVKAKPKTYEEVQTVDHRYARGRLQIEEDTSQHGELARCCEIFRNAVDGCRKVSRQSRGRVATSVAGHGQATNDSMKHLVEAVQQELPPGTPGILEVIEYADDAVECLEGADIARDVSLACGPENSGQRIARTKPCSTKPILVLVCGCSPQHLKILPRPVGHLVGPRPGRLRHAGETNHHQCELLELVLPGNPPTG